MAAHARYLPAPDLLWRYTLRTSVKIKGVLGTCDITYEEFAKLCGLSRQTIHHYLNSNVYVEDFEGGLKAMEVSSKLMHAAVSGVLPLAKSIAKESRIERLKELVV